MRHYLLFKCSLIVLLITVFNIGTKAQSNYICDCVEVKKHKGSSNIDLCSDANLPESKRVEMIACLLRLKGDRSPFWGVATNNSVSQTFGPSPLEVVALFNISYIFYGNKDFADAMVLVDEDGKQNSNESIDIAYKAYKKWFKTVKKIGLEEARKQKLDPLDGSGVRWY